MSMINLKNYKKQKYILILMESKVNKTEWRITFEQEREIWNK